MNRYQKLSIFVLLGIPLFFLVVTFFTGKWGFFLWSLPPSFAAGITGFLNAKRYS